jgi:hypothetical protein
LPGCVGANRMDALPRLRRLCREYHPTAVERYRCSWAWREHVKRMPYCCTAAHLINTVGLNVSCTPLILQWKMGEPGGRGLIGSALGAACSVLAVPMAPKSSYLPLIGSQRYCKHNQIVHLLPLALLLADDRTDGTCYKKYATACHSRVAR